MSDYIMVIVICIGCTGLGNLMGDQATIKDCATKGKASMAGGGTVICEVQRQGAATSGNRSEE